MGWQNRVALWLSVSMAAVACAPKAQPSAPTKSPANAGGAQQEPEPPPAQPLQQALPEVPDVLPGDAREELTTVDEAEAAIGNAETELDGMLGGAPAEALATSRCTRLCRSLGSMGRAVDSLCELTGNGDERCDNARQKLESNKQRVSDAGCAC